MKFKLRDNGDLRIGYSETERRVFELIPVYPRRASSRDIATRRYGDDFPYHGHSIVSGVLRSLAEKIEYNKEKFRIVKSKRAGPYPIEFWLERT